MSHPIVRAIRGMVEQLVPPEEIDDIRGVDGNDSLTIEVHPTTNRAAGVLIGTGGITVDALRHLAARAGRQLPEPIHVTVVVVTAPGSRRER